MKDALIVNPYAREELAEALDEALRMDLGERIRRWQSLMNGVARHDIHAWRDSFIAALLEARQAQAPAAELPRRRAADETDPAIATPAWHCLEPSVVESAGSKQGWRSPAPD